MPGPRDIRKATDKQEKLYRESLRGQLEILDSFDEDAEKREERIKKSYRQLKPKKEKR